jgi:CDP-diacylglycerol---glycerol-3-phosphate 3-phosphatidyltransferase
VLGDKLRPVIEPVTRGIGRGLARLRLTPNALTTFGLLSTLAVAYLISTGDWVLGGWLLIPVLLVDVLDGALARELGKVTRWGGFYDAVCDRLSDGAVLAAVAWSSRSEPEILGATLAAMVASGLVPYTRAKAEAFGFKPANGPGERLERSVLVIVGLVFDVLAVTMWITAALAAFTAIRRSWSARTQAKAAS